MKICSKCGFENNDNAKQCSNCLVDLHWAKVNLGKFQGNAQDTRKMADKGNVQDTRKMADNRGCGIEAKTALAAVGTLIAWIIMSAIILTTVDTLTGQRVDGCFITILAVLGLGVIYGVVGLVRQRSSKLPTQINNTPPIIPEKVIKDPKQVEGERKNYEASFAFRLGRFIRKMLGR